MRLFAQVSTSWWLTQIQSGESSRWHLSAVQETGYSRAEADLANVLIVEAVPLAIAEGFDAGVVVATRGAPRMDHDGEQLKGQQTLRADGENVVVQIKATALLIIIQLQRQELKINQISAQSTVIHHLFTLSTLAEFRRLCLLFQCVGYIQYIYWTFR